MTIVYTPALLANLNNPTTAVTTINQNETSVSTAFVSALNTSGDQMKGTLDMNSNQIINLPAPTSQNSPARLADVAAPGTTLISAVTYNNIQSLPPGTILGNPTGVTGNATAQTGITLPSLISAQSVQSSTMTATTGTFQTLNATTMTVTGNATTNGALDVNSIQYTAPGTPNAFYASGASTGTVSEYISSTQTATVNLANNAITAVTPTMTLTPGDWDVWGYSSYFCPTGNGNFYEIAICNTGGSFSTALPGGTVEVAAATSLGTVTLNAGPVRQLLTSSQTYLINVEANTAGASQSALSSVIQARRWR